MAGSKQPRGASSRAWRTYFGTAGALAFVSNLIWEMAQMRAYRELEIQPWWETLGTCTLAAGGDVLLTLIPYGVGAMVTRDVRWAWSGGAKIYSALAALGFVTAVIGERVGLASGNWAYNERMPIVPGFNVGAWPVLQLTLLIPFAFIVGNAARRGAQG